jgi:hypothetical protein
MYCSGTVAIQTGFRDLMTFEFEMKSTLSPRRYSQLLHIGH